MSGIRPLAAFTCASCQRFHPAATYAGGPEGARYCDPCAHRLTVADMAAARSEGAPFTVYGPQTLARGATVTTWPGGALGRVVAVGARPHPFTVRYRSTWGERYYCHVRDTDGGEWRGWVGAGLASTLRPVAA